jgi:tetratricopeptide (TPR) repeat protein
LKNFTASTIQYAGALHRNAPSILKPLLMSRQATICAWVFSVSLLSACSTLPTATSSAPATVEATRAPIPLIANNDNNDASVFPADLPNVNLSDDLLYKILSAEITFQRGNWQAPYITLLSIAQQTRDPRLAKRAAEMALAAKQLSEALTATRLWRELDPKSGDAEQYYLSFMLLKGDLDEIQRNYEQKLAAAKPDQYGLLMLQAQRFLSGFKEKLVGFQTLEKLLKPYESSADAHIALAQGALQLGDKPRAASEARIALKDKPESQLAILTLAQSLPAQEAMAELSAFLQRAPNTKDVRQAYASMLFDNRQFDQSREQFEEIYRNHPQDYHLLYTLGIVELQRKNFPQAESYFTQFLDAAESAQVEDQDLSRAYMNLAQLAIDRKDFNAAQSWLSKIESFDGRNPAWIVAQVRRAELMSKQGNLADARDFLADIRPNSIEEQVQLIQTEAQLLRGAKKPEEAFQFLKEKVKTVENNPDLYYDLGMLAESLKKLPEMESAFRRAIALAPDNPAAYNALGYSFADRNMHLNEALTLIEKAVSLSKDDPFILDSLGWVKFRLGKYDEAEQALRKAYALRDDAEIAVHLGEVLWAQNKQADAREIWRKVQAKEPQHPSLKSTLQRLKVKL